MSGNQLGAIKAKMGLKGKQPTGALISRMNEMKRNNLKSELKTGQPKVAETIKKII
jgi:hypothetical protein